MAPFHVAWGSIIHLLDGLCVKPATGIPTRQALNTQLFPQPRRHFDEVERVASSSIVR